MQPKSDQNSNHSFIAPFFPHFPSVRQVPYAIGQFTVNEWMHETISKTIPKESIDKWGKAGEISIQLGCGIIAGFAAAILSHVSSLVPPNRL